MKTSLTIALILSLATSTLSFAQETLPDYDPQNPEAANPFLNEGSTSRNRDNARERMGDARARDDRGFVSKVLGGDESLRIEQIDSELGIPLGTYTTADDSSRVGIAFHFNSDLKDMAAISSFEAVFAKKLRKTWIEGSISKTVGRYSEVTENNTALPGVLPANHSLENTDLLTVGLGLMYRTTYIQNLFNSDRFFETIGAALTYNQFDDAFRDETFQGFGIKADFGIHRRFSETFHFGGKLTYHLASVKYPSQFDGQSSNERASLIRWMGLGFDLGFYF